MSRSTCPCSLLSLLLVSPFVCAQTPESVQAAAPTPVVSTVAPVAADRIAPADVVSVAFPEHAFAGPADVRVFTTTDTVLLSGFDGFLDSVPRRFIRDAHAIRITSGQAAPQQTAQVELAVPAALTARSASQDEYLVWARYPQAGEPAPPATFLTMDVRYIQSQHLLRFDLEPSAFTRRGDGQWEAILVLTTPDVQPEPQPAAPAPAPAAATATR